MLKNTDEETHHEAVNTKTARSNNYVEIKIPKLSFKETGSNFYLTFVLIIFAFLIGILTSRVITLQNELKNQNLIPAKQVEAITTTNNINQPNPASQTRVDVALGHLPVLGLDTAKVTVIEFSDFQCPFCKRFIDETYQQLYDNYIKPKQHRTHSLSPRGKYQDKAERTPILNPRNR